MKAFGLTVFCIIILGFYCTGMNVYNLINKCDFVEDYKCEMVNGIGIIPVVSIPIYFSFITDIE